MLEKTKNPFCFEKFDFSGGGGGVVVSMILCVGNIVCSFFFDISFVAESRYVQAGLETKAVLRYIIRCGVSVRTGRAQNECSSRYRQDYSSVSGGSTKNVLLV